MSQALNKAEYTKPQRAQREPFSLSGCYDILRSMSLGVQYNVITGDIDVMGKIPYVSDVRPSKQLDTLATIIHSDYRSMFTGCTTESIWKYLETIANDAQYNPVLNEISMCKWDGIDRLAEVYKILGISEDDDLSRTLIRKWLHQGVSLLNNEEKTPFGADGLLVLCGAQGVGKTSFFRKIAIHPEWFGEGLSINQYDKDTARRVVTSWIAELGELESTLKGDIASLKAFITQSTDRYRLSYARSDTVNVRRTNLCATCNTADFLTDATGNRRFWVVPVNKIDLDALDKLDPLQLWAQIYCEYSQDVQGFRLSHEERALLEERNRAHQKALPAEDEILDILTEAEGHPDWWQDTTITNFMSCYPPLQKYSATKVSKALKKLGYVTQMKRVESVTQRSIRLPIRSHYGYSGG